MKKKTLEEKTQTVLDETKEALQAVYDALNQGQRKKIVKDTKVRELFDRYGVSYQE